MSIIGNPLVTTNYISDSFSGDASTVAFTLSQAPASAASIAVYISGLYQIPTSAYSISGTTLTFTGAPPTGTNNITVLHLGVKSATLVPVNGSVTPQMLSNANVVYWSASNNNVGIGNVTPTSLLTVTGTAALGNTTITGTLTASANVNLDSGTFFVDGTNNRVGINNTAPTSALTVTGTAALGNTTFAGTISANGGVGTAGQILTSGATGNAYWSTVSTTLDAVLGTGNTTTKALTTGTLTVNGAITASGSVLPGANNSYDLGSLTMVWRNMYTGDLFLSNEGHGQGNDVDGTKGKWTIQEGAEDLFIINRSNSKKYRFKLEEM